MYMGWQEIVCGCNCLVLKKHQLGSFDRTRRTHESPNSGLPKKDQTYLWAMATIGAPVGVPGKGPDEPAMSMCEYLSGASESMPCCKDTSASFSTFVHTCIHRH